jgi:hypothetical protein
VHRPLRQRTRGAAALAPIEPVRSTVIATTRVTIANTAKTMYIAEQFTFSGRKLVDVRVHVCDAPRKT